MFMPFATPPGFRSPGTCRSRRLPVGHCRTVWVNASAAWRVAPCSRPRVRVVDLDSTLEAYHDALGHIVNGDAEPLQRLYSHRDDVTLSNPWGPSRRGWADVSAGVARAASQFRDGAPQSRPHDHLALFVGADLVCLVENERWQA